jgi:hypothetical protein
MITCQRTLFTTPIPVDAPWSMRECGEPATWLFNYCYVEDTGYREGCTPLCERCFADSLDRDRDPGRWSSGNVHPEPFERI